MKVVFFGNSDFSVLVLRKLDFCKVLVVTSHDKPKGRGLVLHQNPVKLFCMKYGLTFIHDDDWDFVRRKIVEFSPHFLVVSSYGRIIPPGVLEVLDRKRRINIHPSLLPRWRGPAPIQWAILSGDKKTGVSFCTVDEKVDKGGIIFQKEVEISEDDDFLTLGNRLFEMGGELLKKVMEDVLQGRVKLREQDENMATWARAIKKEDGFFSFDENADFIHRKMRAFCVWPKIYTFLGKERIIVHKTFLFEDKKLREGKRAGDILKIDERGIYVACGKDESGGIIILSLLQREGKKVLSGKDFANGMRMKVGDNILDYAR